MKDKRLTDLEDKIKNDVLKGTFNLGDQNDPNSVIGMAMSFLRGANNLGVEEHDPASTQYLNRRTIERKAILDSMTRELVDAGLDDQYVDLTRPASLDDSAPSGTWVPFGRLGGVGVKKCDCGCWEGKICTNSKRIIK